MKYEVGDYVVMTITKAFTVYRVSSVDDLQIDIKAKLIAKSTNIGGNRWKIISDELFYTDVRPWSCRESSIKRKLTPEEIFRLKMES